MQFKTIVPALVAASALFAVAVPAQADDNRCRNVPRAEWRPMEDALAAVKAKGYEIREIKVDDGCYKAKVTGKSGERMKLYLDPASLEVVQSSSKR